jgi:hypothetical protein
MRIYADLLRIRKWLPVAHLAYIDISESSIFLEHSMELYAFS